MIEFQLKYNNRRNSISNISFPSSWNELSIDQLLFISQNWQSWRSIMKNNMSILSEKCKLFLNLLPAKSKSEIKKAISNISPESLYDLSVLTDFVFEENTLTKCPIPEIKNGEEILFAPADGLKNIVALEFVACDHYFMKYHDEKKDEILSKLIASLYRPRLKDSLERVAFSRGNDDKYFSVVNKLSEEKKQLILLWYIGCRSQIVKKYSDIFSNENQSEAKSTGWLPVILELSGNKFGTFEQTAQTDFHLILMELRQMKNRKPKKQN